MTREKALKWRLHSIGLRGGGEKMRARLTMQGLIHHTRAQPDPTRTDARALTEAAGGWLAS